MKMFQDATAKRHYCRWTAAEDRRLLAEMQDYRDAARVAALLRKTTCAIQRRWYRLVKESVR